MRKVLANLLFIFLGLPLALSALMLISVRPWALDRDAYKRFVEDDRLYAALQAPGIANRAPETIRLGPASFDGRALASAAQKDLPWPEIKSTASRAVDTALDAALSAAPENRAELDLRPLKAALRAKSPAAARDYAAALAAGDHPAAAQKPSDTAKALTAAIDALPDSAKVPPPSQLRRIGGPMGVLSRGPGIGNEALSQELLNRMTATTAAVSALLLAALGALGGSGALSRIARAGKYLLLPSILVLALGTVLAIPSGLILQNLLPHDLQGMVGGSGGAQLRAYLASALGPIARSFFITGLVGASLGGMLTQAKRLDESKEPE